MEGRFWIVLNSIYTNITLSLVSLFNGISTFKGYLMPKSSLYKNSSGTI